MKRYECTGCGACYNACTNGCIVMKKAFDGCYYPAINREECISCGKCIKVCPVRNASENNKEYKISDVYVGHSKDGGIRAASSSGGIFPLAADWIISQSGVVFGACFQKSKVVHVAAGCKKEITQLKGSKYVQSDIKETYLEAEAVLKKEKPVLFTGVPCQIEGLKSYLGKEYKNLYTIDLICHGVGAPGIWEKYLDVFHKKKEIKEINFKNKDNGWNHEQFVIKYADGREYRRNPLDDCYTCGFNTNVFLRPSCYNCKFKGIERNCDLTIGDAWGVERYAPKFHDDKGCSLILVHSKKGEEVFEAISEWIEWKKVDINKAVRFNQRMISSAIVSSGRESFYEDLKKYPFRIAMNKMKKREKMKNEYSSK